MATPAERYDALLRWVEEDGGSLNPSIEIYHDEATKGSFRVKDSCSIGPDDTIVTLPLAKSLSFLNAIDAHPEFSPAASPSFLGNGNHHYFPTDFLKRTPPHVVSRFFLMQEYLRGPESSWWPYIRTLTQPEHMASILPAMWPSEDIEFLKGTNAFIAIQEIRSNLKKEFKEAMKLLPEEYHLDYTRPLYHWAYCIFTSRSFRPSLVLPDIDSLELPCDMDDFSVLLPLFDMGNHSSFAKAAWSIDEEAQVCKLRTRQAYSAGDQVFNNYGMKTNAEMLLGYGFILPEDTNFHNDYVHIRTKANPEAGDLAASHIVSLRPIADPGSPVGRSRLLNPVFTGCLPCFSHIQDSLVAALYESIAKGAAETNDVSLTDIMRGDIPADLILTIVNTLGSKLSIDLEEIEANEPEYEPANRNQELATRYTEQCKKVLVNTLRSLMTADV
ncbi:SET domain-containing protein [Xylariaceae sp. FL0662B]|nr:SET domain-containing protein [Xylariaceae sp. FL0662B]